MTINTSHNTLLANQVEITVFRLCKRPGVTIPSEAPSPFYVTEHEHTLRHNPPQHSRVIAASDKPISLEASRKSAFPLQQPHSSLTSYRQDGFHLSQPFFPSSLRRSKTPRTVRAKSPDSTSTAKPTPPHQPQQKPKPTASIPDKFPASATHNPNANAKLHPTLLRREHAESRSRSRRQRECYFSIGASPGEGNGYPEGLSSFEAAAAAATAAVATGVLVIGTSVTASEISAIAMDMFSDCESTNENIRQIHDGGGHVSDSDSEVLLALQLDSTEKLNPPKSTCLLPTQPDLLPL